MPALIETLNLLAFRHLSPLLSLHSVSCGALNFAQTNCLLITESYINAKWGRVREFMGMEASVQAAQLRDTQRAPTVPCVPHIDAGHLERADLQNMAASREAQG